jgi:hypothetical protein
MQFDKQLYAELPQILNAFEAKHKQSYSLEPDSEPSCVTRSGLRSAEVLHHLVDFDQDYTIPESARRILLPKLIHDGVDARQALAEFVKLEADSQG